MNNQEIRQKIANVLRQNGFDFDENKNDELYFDSLQFISALVEIENEFDIEIPNTYLSGDNLNTFDDYCRLVECLCNARSV